MRLRVLVYIILIGLTGLGLTGCPPQRGGGVITRVDHLQPGRNRVPRIHPVPDWSRPGQISYAALKNRVIVIDAGHGGNDPGTRGLAELSEKQVNLAIAQELKAFLMSHGAQVIMTRRADRFIELDSRASIADQNKADLFVSIHADYSPKTGVNGATVLIGRTALDTSKKAAESITAALERAGIHTRPVRVQQLRVLEGHSRPAVLVECGFMSNPAEAANLVSLNYQKKIARAIGDGIGRLF